MATDPRLVSLRIGWLMLGCLIAVTFAESSSAGWYIVVGIPWIVSGALLFRTVPRTRVAEALRESASHSVFTVGLVLVATVHVLIAHLFSPSAAVFVLTWLGAWVLLIAAIRGAGALTTAVGLGSMSMVLLVLVAGVMELVFESRSLSRQFGSPAELAAWNARYDQLWTRNVLGFRTRHEHVGRRVGTRRILALGDSFTWGDKIASSDSTWPAQLESSLNAAGAGAVEVFNWGRSGFTTANEAELLRRLGWQLNPDVVILQFLVNDALPSSPNFKWESSTYLEPPVRLVPTRFRRGAIRDSALLSFLERTLTMTRYQGASHLRYKQLFDTTFVGWRQLSDGLREIGDSARARNVPVIVVLSPKLVPGIWTAHSHPFATEHAQVAAVASHAGLYVLDLADAFGRYRIDWVEWWATPYDAHPSAAAHLLAAETIRDFIQKHDLLGPSAP